MRVGGRTSRHELLMPRNDAADSVLSSALRYQWDIRYAPEPKDTHRRPIPPRRRPPILLAPLPIREAEAQVRLSIRVPKPRRHRVVLDAHLHVLGHAPAVEEALADLINGEN